MNFLNLHIIALLTVILGTLFGCTEDETPVEVIQPPLETPILTPQEIAQIALRSTVLLRVKRTNEESFGSGFFVDNNQVVTNYHVIDSVTSATVE